MTLIWKICSPLWMSLGRREPTPRTVNWFSVVGSWLVSANKEKTKLTLMIFSDSFDEQISLVSVEHCHRNRKKKSNQVRFIWKGKFPLDFLLMHHIMNSFCAVLKSERKLNTIYFVYLLNSSMTDLLIMLLKCLMVVSSSNNHPPPPGTISCAIFAHLGFAYKQSLIDSQRLKIAFHTKILI